MVSLMNGGDNIVNGRYGSSNKNRTKKESNFLKFLGAIVTSDDLFRAFYAFH